MIVLNVPPFRESWLLPNFQPIQNNNIHYSVTLSVLNQGEALFVCSQSLFVK